MTQKFVSSSRQSIVFPHLNDSSDGNMTKQRGAKIAERHNAEYWRNKQICWKVGQKT